MLMDIEKQQICRSHNYGLLEEESLTQWYMMQQQYKDQTVIDIDIDTDLLNIIAKRDIAVEERNQAFLEKEKAFKERQVAIIQRNLAIKELNDAVSERNNALASLQQSMLEPTYLELQPPCKRLKRDNTTAHHKKKMNVVDVLCKTMASSEHSAKLGLKKIDFDDLVMPIPGCSCTGVLRRCYKWGNGGWQSSCCTHAMSAFPLPRVPNKRYCRKGGRKMSGSVFSKLVSRLAVEGYDFSRPVDLKDHWSKHGTNRYVTIK